MVNLGNFEIVEQPRKLTKVVNYFGHLMVIPRFHNFVATDKDGSVFSYKKKPSDRIISWDGDNSNYICNLKYAGFWQNSMCEYPKDYEVTSSLQPIVRRSKNKNV